MGQPRYVRRGRIGPPIAHRDTSTWGKRLEIRAGVPTVAGGTGIGPDIRNPKRLIDVRVPTDRPGVASRSIVVYATARIFYNAAVVTQVGAPTNSLVGVLQTGSGGLTREERFIMPAHGKTIHIGADSVRMHMVYEPREDLATAVDGVYALAGFVCQANCSIAGLYPGEVRQDSEVWNTAAVPTSTAVQSFAIPEFSESLQLVHDSLGDFDVEWEDVFGNAVMTPLSGLQYAEPRPIPVEAAGLTITFTIPAPGFAQPMTVRWFRPS